MSVRHHPYPALPMQVLHTKGSDLEIGRQHGEMLKEVLSVGMSRFYLEFWRRMMRVRSAGLMEGVFLKFGRFLIDPVLVNRLKKNVPDWAVNRLKGMAESSQFNEEELLSTLVLPDLMPLLQSYLGRIRPSAHIEASHPPRFGCTSFLVKDQSFYQGRNLDFPGVSYWDRYPVIQLIERKDKLKYIGFCSTGVPMAGITGINEAQIMVALHQHYSKATSLKGVLPFVISEKILAEATTLEEATEIINQEEMASSWAFVVSDGKSGNGFLYECDSEGRGQIRYQDRDDVLCHANYFQTKECRRREYATTARMNWDNFSRKKRLSELLRKEDGSYSAGRLVQILSDHFDPYWGEEKVMNRTVSQVYNIQSLVVNLSEMKAYIAEGNSPIHLREYHEFDLGAIFSEKEGRTGVKYPGFSFKDEKKKVAKTEYVLSFVAAFDGDFEKARSRIQLSLESEFVPEAALVYSVLELKSGNYSRGLELLSLAKSYIENKKKLKGLDLFPPEYFEIWLFLARTMDLLGRREAALAEYRMLACHRDLEDANVRKLATSKLPYTPKRLDRILMPYSTYIPFE